MGYIRHIILVIFITGLTVLPAMAADSGSTQMVPASFSQLAEHAKTGVVNIQTEKTIQGGGRVFQHFFGSPFGGNQEGLERFFSVSKPAAPVPEGKKPGVGIYHQ